MEESNEKKMRHYMRLDEGPFRAIKAGRKTVEMRLWDEKRRLIRVGDVIEFSLRKDKNETFAVTVTALSLFPDFDALYAAIPPERLGYDRKTAPSASPDDMLAFYSREEQEKWGVVGIGMELIGKGEKTLTPVGKYLTYLLRHCPEAASLHPDPHGYVGVEELIGGVRKKYPEFDRAMLDEIVRTDPKCRFAFSPDGRSVRASQGHSIAVDVQPEEKEPPAILYHGTGEGAAESILRAGLLPRSRLYVHLSSDLRTAKSVGIRHGRPVVFTVDAASMVRDGYRFFLSENGVWLTKAVPACYLSVLEEDD